MLRGARFNRERCTLRDRDTIFFVPAVVTIRGNSQTEHEAPI